MTEPWHTRGARLHALLGEKLRDEGYDIVIEPRQDQLPFALAGYQPDLIASKDDGGYIIEVKQSEPRIAIDRYVEVAALVRQHPGWRFLLVPAERLEEPNFTVTRGLPSWERLRGEAEQASALARQGFGRAAFLIGWSALEGTLRLMGEGQGVPVAALSSIPLIKHLYSQGILSRETLQTLEKLVAVRNRVVHGFEDPTMEVAAPLLIEVLMDLLMNPEGSRPAI
jgi:hypothetical protein